MPRFAANLTMMFTEYPVLERFDRAAAAGFTAVEFLFPHLEEIDALAAALSRNRLELVNFNLPPGDWVKGERGIANDPRRRDEFRAGLHHSIATAQRLNVPKINCISGLILPDVPLDDQWQALRDNLTLAADETAKAGIRQLVEPINQFDIPGFFLNTPSRGFALLEEIAHPNLFLEYDVYHAQRTEGNLAATITNRIGKIGHIQIADSPGRNQPGTGEINYPFIFQTIDAAGYDGWIALEYRPSGASEDSLDWMKPYEPLAASR